MDHYDEIVSDDSKDGGAGDERAEIAAKPSLVKGDG